MQRRQQFKKPSSTGASNPAKIEVQGHSVYVAIIASCFLSKLLTSVSVPSVSKTGQIIALTMQDYYENQM